MQRQPLCQAAPHSGSPDPKHTQATSWATSAYEQLVLLQPLGSLWILKWSFLVLLSLGSGCWKAAVSPLRNQMTASSRAGAAADFQQRAPACSGAELESTFACCVLSSQRCARLHAQKKQC